MRKTTLAPGNFCFLFTWTKFISVRWVTWCYTTGNPSLKVASGQRKTHVNSYRRQTVDRGKPVVTDLPQDKQLPRVHANRTNMTLTE